MRKPKRILLPQDRRKIAEMYANGEMITDIAREIGVNRCTIYRELSRGYTGTMDRNGRPGYDHDLAQKNLHPRWKRAAQTTQ